jgi:hypothetical protein
VLKLFFGRLLEELSRRFDIVQFGFGGSCAIDRLC